MSDPKPLFLLLGLQLAGSVLAVGWWTQLPDQARRQRLATIAQQEQAHVWPPSALLDQAHWLVTHRLARLAGLVGLSALGLLIGLGEGLARRQHDPWAGVRLQSWTLGVLGMVLLPGLVAGLILLPIPWSLTWVGGAGALWSAGVGYAVQSGRPDVP